MAEVIKIKRLSREDFKDAPPWIDRLIGWLNQFVEFVTLAFNGDITFDQNIRSQIKSFEVIAGASADLCTAQFRTTLKVAPRGVLMMKVTERSGNYVVLTNPISWTWRFETGTIYITSIAGLTNGATYDFYALVI